MEGREENAAEDFAYTRLTPSPEGFKPGKQLRDIGFEIFLVQVKSETCSGQDLRHDPLKFLRERIPEMRTLLDGTDVHATVLRVNAEVPANPRHTSEVWCVYQGSTTAVGVQFKHTDYTDAE